MERVNCSRCGATEDLHVIVLGRPCGRLLVYCPACRQQPGITLGFNEPLNLVTPDVVAQLSGRSHRIRTEHRPGDHLRR